MAAQDAVQYRIDVYLGGFMMKRGRKKRGRRRLTEKARKNRGFALLARTELSTVIQGNEELPVPASSDPHWGVSEGLSKNSRGCSHIHDGLAAVCGDIPSMISAWERNVDVKMYSHEGALATDHIVASLILFAQNALPGAHTYAVKDATEPPKSSGPGAEEGGEVLEMMYVLG
jgi:hypothetical protein